ncbi:1-phosphofructokinase family hexose kinase [Microbulbifer magnicolonia]|uniref:1-phosphofructokinase family hexose kinase n=1 Tax=Microbulbifer magnicolonia TaxID=3109744 RepID=UPI002B40ACE9|nr:1-phosphofructokinase family hexose kinase [Microbulbifer sp. GG15]
MIWTLTMNPALDLAVTTPRLEIKRKLRCREASFTPGGGGINCSRAIANLGGESRAMVICGGGTGEIIERQLRDAGIAIERVDVEGHSRINVLANPEDEEGAYRLVLPGPELLEHEWQSVLRRLEEVLDHSSLLIASGSLPPGVPEDFYARVAAVARRSGAQMFLDSPPAALRRALADEYLFAIKPNRSEWQQIRGGGGDRRALIERAEAVVRVERRVGIILISMGGEGALCVTRERSEYIEAPAVDVVDTTGAGDSMFGAFALAIAGGQSPSAAARYAVAAGAAAVEEFGSTLCRSDRLAEILARMRDSQPG